MSENAVTVKENNTMSMVMNADLEQVTKQLQAISNFQAVVQNNLKSGQDFGVIPGTQKPTLLKPGAEKIQMLFGVTSEYEEIERIQDYEKGFFAYTIKCVLSQNGTKITEGMGHCNTKEKKYIRQDPFTLANTCLKMAKKRAQIDATLTIASLSEVFTQDMEDLQHFAQQETMETMNNGDASKMKVTFGKHKGKTLGEINKEDSSYLEWLKDKAKQPEMRQAAEMVLNGDTSQQTKYNKPNDTNQPEKATDSQIKAIMTKASTIGNANDMTAEKVIAAYRIEDVNQIDKRTASDLIGRLETKVQAIESKSKEEPETVEGELFDSNNPPFEGTPVDIDEDDLPF